MIRTCLLLLSSIFATMGCGPDYGIIDGNNVRTVFVEIPGKVTAMAGTIWVDSFIQPSTLDGVDVLWVIDTSGSMVDDEHQLLLGIEAMINALPINGWRLNMISNSPNVVGSDQQFPLVPGDTIADAKTMYKNMNRSWLEEGFDALYEYVTANPYASTWMRPDAALLIVFVSDEEDQSDLTVSEFVSWYEGLRSSVFLASIVHLDPADSLCNFSTYNTAYNSIDATNHFNGVIVDICSEDWSAGVTDASIQVEPYEWYELTRKPSDNKTIRVFIDGKLNQDWYYESSENIVYFDIIPDAGALVEIAYLYFPLEIQIPESPLGGSN